MQIPKSVSGVPVTNYGVHLLPFGFHSKWMQKVDYWIDLLRRMGMSWCLAMSEGDALLISGAAKALLDAGVIPIVRFAYQFPARFTEMKATEQLVALYAKYNAPCIIQFANEPLDSREWRAGNVPKEDEAWAIIADRWNEAARLIAERGAIAGFPDGPCYDRNPFRIIGDENGLWQTGQCVYITHNYNVGRPLGYNRDVVSRTGYAHWDAEAQVGQLLTMDEYREQLDEYADDRSWNEGPEVLAQMNAQRLAWANPSGSPIQDDTCWRGWEKTLWYSREAFGFEVPIAMGEGGQTPRARAGSGDRVDIRWPYCTPRQVAEKTLEMYRAKSPLFAICPWLLASDDMGATGWYEDCWVGGAYSDRYGREKPVVQVLEANPPSPAPEPPEPEPPAPEPPRPPVGELWGQVQGEVRGIVALLHSPT
jgi:hypothetical protein